MMRGAHSGLPRDNEGRTPLHLAALLGQSRLIDNIYAFRVDGDTRLFSHAQFRRLHPEELDQQDDTGKTALEYCRDEGTADAFDRLYNVCRQEQLRAHLWNRKNCYNGYIAHRPDSPDGLENLSDEELEYFIRANHLDFDSAIAPGNDQQVDAVAVAFSSRPRLRFVCRDERADELRRRLSAASVFGIVEAKGLEFDDVCVVDFFGADGRAWKRLLAGDGPAAPPSYARELKLLYTAVTRARHRLLFVDTERSAGAEAWSRAICGRGLAQGVAPADVGARAMLPDDWRAEGLEIAAAAEGETAGARLRRAAECFGRAGDAPLAERANTHARAAELAREGDGAEAVRLFLEARVYADAADLCARLCDVPRLGRLPDRIRRL